MIEEEGLPFPGPEFTSVESGPGPLPEIVENQAILCRGLREKAFSVSIWLSQQVLGAEHPLKLPVAFAGISLEQLLPLVGIRFTAFVVV